jgi:hypothetical protein
MDVGAVLLGRVRRLFARDGVAGEEAADRPIADRYAFVGERLAQLFDRDVGRRREEGEDRRAIRLNPTRAAVSTLATRASFAPLARERPPAANACGADPEPFAGLPMAQALRNRRQHPNPKIKR